MVNKKVRVNDIVEVLGREYKIGNLYRNDLFQKYESSKVQSIVDIDTENGKGTYNFHFCLKEDKEEEILKEVCTCIDKRSGSLKMNGKNYSNLFRYIWVSINDVKYELNFMRFFISNENEVNCILESAQFDKTYTDYINSNGVCYPKTPFGQINELDNIIQENRKKNFCYNPASSIFDAENLAKEFIEFICKCESYDGKLGI